MGRFQVTQHHSANAAWIKIAEILAIVLALVIAPLVRTAAQGNNEITYGQTVSGHISNDAFRIVYTFQGRKGDIIDATLIATDGTLDPELILADAQNNLIARDDDSGANLSAAILSQQLPGDGLYFLIATRFGQERGLTVGSFRLTLSHVGITASSDAPLQYGDSIVGEISDAQFQHIYSFRATRGEIIKITMQRISGDLDSMLILADASGNVLLTDDEDPDSPGTLDAAIRNLRIEKTGNYVLVATRFGREAGESQGGFSLVLDRLPPESLGKVPEKAVLIDFGGTANGNIDADHLMFFYLIEAKKGDVLTIEAQRTKGNLDPILILYTADLKQLAENDSGVRGQNARITAFNVPADGKYILMVSRFNRDKGITAGSYALSVVGRSGVVVGAGGKLTLQYGGAVSAIIGSGNIEQHFSFTAAAGDVITITMDVTSGNLLPALLPFRPSGKQNAGDEPGTGNAQH